MTRLLILGHGRVGSLVEMLAPEYGFEIAGLVRSESDVIAGALDAGRLRGVDVAVDFSTAEAVPANLPRLARAGINVVVGTTGWQADETRLREVVRKAGTGVVVAPNFSLGVAVLTALVQRAAMLMAGHAAFGAWIHETHHAEKRDAPSGTALALERTLIAAGYARPIHVASTRVGSVPGTHVVGFDGPAETLTLTHRTRDRSTFARGALDAARWVIGRQGWFSIEDVLGLDFSRPLRVAGPGRQTGGEG